MPREFDESEHPRRPDGVWTDGSGESKDAKRIAANRKRSREAMTKARDDFNSNMKDKIGADKGSGPNGSDNQPEDDDPNHGEGGPDSRATGAGSIKMGEQTVKHDAGSAEFASNYADSHKPGPNAQASDGKAMTAWTSRYKLEDHTESGSGDFKATYKDTKTGDRFTVTVKEKSRTHSISRLGVGVDDAKFTSLSTPNEINIVTERADGSGVVELPILRTHESIDLGRTATVDGAGLTDSITIDDLNSAVSNFNDWPGPVPIFRAPHRSMSESQGASDGFFDALWVKGEELWARVDLTTSLFKEVMARQWRGFSVDYGRGANLATKRLVGFLVAGGVFTNRPAADIHFKAAAGVEFNGELASFFTEIGKSESGAEETSMPKENEDITVSLATAEARAKSESEKVIQLTATLELAKKHVTDFEEKYEKAVKQVNSLSAEVSSLRVRSDNRSGDIKDLEDKIVNLEEGRRELRTKLEMQENESVGAKVSALCIAAIKEGVPPAKIKELGDFEKDPVGWLTSNFATLSTAAHFLKSLPRDASLSAARKGVIDESDSSIVAMGKERLDNLRGLGLKPELASVQSQSQYEALVEAGKVNSKK